jgi:hypothetical protein
MCRPAQSKTKTRTVATAALFGTLLVGCSDIYSDRRETVSPLTGDALAANRVGQMIDPWSRASANNNIVYNGEKMQSAHERYRTGRVIQPVNTTTSAIANAQAAQAASGAPAPSAPATPSVK